MNNIKLKQINKRFISSIMAGIITVGLVGCDKNINSNLISSATIIKDLSENKKLNFKKTLVLTNDEKTLFVEYKNVKDLYVTDIFTGTNYRIYNNDFYNRFSNSVPVEYIINDDVFIYNKKYYCEEINDYLESNNLRTNEYKSYDGIRKLFISLNNITGIDNKSSIEEKIDIKNIIALTNGKEVLFVKYNTEEDMSIINIFNNKTYVVNESYNNVGERLNSGSYIIDNNHYKIEPITTYAYIVENIVDEKISKSVLKESFKDTNMNIKNLKKSLTK